MWNIQKRKCVRRDTNTTSSYHWQTELYHGLLLLKALKTKQCYREGMPLRNKDTLKLPSWQTKWLTWQHLNTIFPNPVIYDGWIKTQNLYTNHILDQFNALWLKAESSHSFLLLLSIILAIHLLAFPLLPFKTAESPRSKFATFPSLGHWAQTWNTLPMVNSTSHFCIHFLQQFMCKQ